MIRGHWGARLLVMLGGLVTLPACGSTADFRQPIANQATQTQSTSDSAAGSSAGAQPASPTQANDGRDVGCVSPGPGETYCGQGALDWCNQNAGAETYVQGTQCESVYNRHDPSYLAEPPCRQAGGGPDCTLKYCQIYSHLANTISSVKDVAQNYVSDETLSAHSILVLHEQASEMRYWLARNQPSHWRTQFSHLMAVEADAVQVRTLSVDYAAADQQASHYGQGALADTPAPDYLLNATQNDGSALDALNSKLGDETNGLGGRC